MPDEFLAILTSFHREILLPDMQRIADASEARLNARVDELFAAVHQRFDRLERRRSELDAS